MMSNSPQYQTVTLIGQSSNLTPAAQIKQTTKSGQGEIDKAWEHTRFSREMKSNKEQLEVTVLVPNYKAFD